MPPNQSPTLPMQLLGHRDTGSRSSRRDNEKILVENLCADVKSDVAAGHYHHCLTRNLANAS